MPLDRLNPLLEAYVEGLEDAGTAKGAEAVVKAVRPPAGGEGPRFMLEGQGETPFMRMNSNSYLGMGLRPEVIEAEMVSPGAGALSSVFTCTRDSFSDLPWRPPRLNTCRR